METSDWMIVQLPAQRTAKHWIEQINLVTVLEGSLKCLSLPQVESMVQLIAVLRGQIEQATLAMVSTAPPAAHRRRKTQLVSLVPAFSVQVQVASGHRLRERIGSQHHSRKTVEIRSEAWET
jgi:hypothetical protein